MERKQNRLVLVLALVGFVGWVAAVGMAAAAAKARVAETLANAQAADWKRQAGKAYTELLAARSGMPDGSIVLPAGTQISSTYEMVTENGRAVARWTNAAIYPPKGY
ncbi:hypothetical protein [Burkholderia sp. Ac-20365]|uniref:hypothetical protein n=1 Tax=Burkholderia sp. Ac-20365 TaxID=2703897 RepID=UPI00197C78C3|nr:hypothetical protein [Burkholderia sp. Ac-20365]MBN3761264.1 hypothetical protein [Burkholderia sp. Ac-20365]